MRPLVVSLFSFSRDSLALKQAILRIREIEASRPTRPIIVTVFDDALSPTSDSDIEWLFSQPGINEYVKTSFNRNRNLNGIDCIIGMLRCQSLIVWQYGAIGSVKLDCDTILNSLDWAYTNHYAIGFETAPLRMIGPAYFLNSEALRYLLDYFSSRKGTFAPGTEDALPEDMTISAAAFIQYGKKAKLHQWSKGRIGGHRLTDEDHGKYPGCYVLNFGNRGSISEESIRDKLTELTKNVDTGLWPKDVLFSGEYRDLAQRQIAAKHMERYRLSNPIQQCQTPA